MFILVFAANTAFADFPRLADFLPATAPSPGSSVPGGPASSSPTAF